jgi:hypothetical protein
MAIFVSHLYSGWFPSAAKGFIKQFRVHHRVMLSNFSYLLTICTIILIYHTYCDSWTILKVNWLLEGSWQVTFFFLVHSYFASVLGYYHCLLDNGGWDTTAGHTLSLCGIFNMPLDRHSGTTSTASCIRWSSSLRSMAGQISRPMSPMNFAVLFTSVPQLIPKVFLQE